MLYIVLILQSEHFKCIIWTVILRNIVILNLDSHKDKAIWEHLWWLRQKLPNTPPRVEILLQQVSNEIVHYFYHHLCGG